MGHRRHTTVTRRGFLKVGSAAASVVVLGPMPFDAMSLTRRLRR